jgi:hypothetical protein
MEALNNDNITANDFLLLKYNINIFEVKSGISRIQTFLLTKIVQSLNKIKLGNKIHGST